MGRTFVDVLVENYNDVALREAGHVPRKRIRKENVKALVDTGSAMLCLHKAMIGIRGRRSVPRPVLRIFPDGR